MRTMGVEEEYLLVGPDGVPVAVAGAAVKQAVQAPPGSGPGGDLDTELTQQQLEAGTRPCTDAGELLTELRDGRARAREAAEAAGARVAALGTSPLLVPTAITPNPRYAEMTRQFALTAREQLTCGCHVHVQVADDDEGVAVVDRIGPWLAPLLALAANSPFWHGRDSGYASYRAQVWGRWPTAGPVGWFGSAAEYHRVVDDLVASRTALDRGMIYFDARLSAVYPTVEIRVADVCLRAEDAALVAVLARALVETAAREAAEGAPERRVRVEQLRVAAWRASRSGLSGDLLSPTTFRPVPAADAVGEVLAHAEDALRDAGDLDAARAGVERLLRDGTAADLQRSWAAGADLGAVVDRAVEVTAG